MKLPTISINKDILKIIALVTMTIDHIAQYFNFIPHIDILRYIGRTSFPIFAFLLMEHLCQKQIFKKYAIRLSCFGVLTLVVLFPYHGITEQSPIYPLNIMFTFLNAVLAILAYEWIKKEDVTIYLKIFALIFNFICFSLISLTTQYSISGFCYLLMIYFYYKRPSRINYIMVLILSILINTSHYWWIISFISTLFLLQIKENKVYPRLLKPWWIFYLYYPLHLWLLIYISCLLK